MEGGIVGRRNRSIADCGLQIADLKYSFYYNSTNQPITNQPINESTNLESLNQMAPDTPVIVLGHPNDAQLIVKAIKAGAFVFITKPYPPEKINKDPAQGTRLKVKDKN